MCLFSDSRLDRTPQRTFGSGALAASSDEDTGALASEVGVMTFLHEIRKHSSNWLNWTSDRCGRQIEKSPLAHHSPRFWLGSFGPMTVIATSRTEIDRMSVLRDLEDSRKALSKSRYQTPTHRKAAILFPDRVTFLTGAHRDFSNWRRQAAALHSAPIMEFTRSAFAPKAEVRRGWRDFRKAPED